MSLAGPLHQVLIRLNPLVVTFCASLVLSWVAGQGKLVNRDGILYLHIARTLVEEGYTEAAKYGDLTFLPMLIAALSYVVPIGYETLAKLLSALFMAGACLLMVDIVRRRVPDATWFAVLVVLAMPAYNQYRNEILREYGFWFFSMLGFWYAMRLQDRPGWREALSVQITFMLAALFRLEALSFLVAISCWQTWAAPVGERLRRVGMMIALPLAGGVALGLLIATGTITTPSRMAYYMTAANPLQKIEIFSVAAARMSDHVFSFAYSREEAGYILFFGLLSVIPMKFLNMMGVMLVPFAFQCARGKRRFASEWPSLAWGFGAFCLVLAGFVTHNMFLVGRYVSTLNLLAVPFIALGLSALSERFPRAKFLLLALVLVTIFANVVSTSARANHILEAGNWLRQHVDDKTRVGVENARIPYYAGWKMSRAPGYERKALAEELAAGRIDLAVFEFSRKETEIDAWLSQHHLVALQRFVGEKGDLVILAAREQR